MTSSKPGMTRIVAGESAVPTRRRAVEAALAIGLVLLIAVGAIVASNISRNTEAQAAEPTPAEELKLGYFGNVTHAPALVGISKGFLSEALGGTKLSTETFNAGPALNTWVLSLVLPSSPAMKPLLTPTRAGACVTLPK